MQQELTMILEEVKKMQERTSSARRERAARDRDLRDDLEAQRAATAKLSSSLDCAVVELQKEMADLQAEHSELTQEYQTLFQKIRSDLQGEVEAREARRAELMQQIGAYDALADAEAACRLQQMMDTREEVVSTLQRQVEQETAATDQGNSFIWEVNSLLETETIERARRDVAIMSSVGSVSDAVLQASDRLNEAEQDLASMMETQHSSHNGQLVDLRAIGQEMEAVQSRIDLLNKLKWQQGRDVSPLIRPPQQSVRAPGAKAPDASLSPGLQWQVRTPPPSAPATPRALPATAHVQRLPSAPPPSHRGRPMASFVVNCAAAKLATAPMVVRAPPSPKPLPTLPFKESLTPRPGSPPVACSPRYR
jgi:hypothetical protein